MEKLCGSYSAAESNRRDSFKKCLRKNHFLLLILLSTVLGIIIGTILRGVGPFREPKLHPREMMYLQFPGEITLNIMKLLALPMIFCSFISGIGALDSQSSGIIGLRALCYYVGTTTVAVCEGLGWIYAVKPGRGTQIVPNDPTVTISRPGHSQVDNFLDLIRNVFPENLVTMMFQVTKTVTSFKEMNITDPETNITRTVMLENISFEKHQSLNLLGTAVVAVTLGMMLQGMGERGRPLLNAFDVMFEIIMKIIKKFIYVAPLGILFKIAFVIIRIPDPLGTLKALALYMVTVIAGLLTHLLVTLPIIYWIFTRTNPYKYMRGCGKMFAMAAASNNSNLTLPITMNCLENMKKDTRIIRFMCPLGATVNMDGVALYEVMIVVFMAQQRGRDLVFGDLLTIAILSILISIGCTTATSGLVILMLLFESVGLPIEDAFLVTPLDPILGRVRTCVNVWGDCIGVAVVEKLSAKQLGAPEDEIEELQSKQKDSESGDEIESLKDWGSQQM